TADGTSRCEHAVDFGERARMHLRIRVDESENLSAGDARAAVARGGDDAFLDRHNLASARLGNARRAVRRTVVGNDDFDLAGATIRVARHVDRIEPAGGEAFLV